jgi:hypothetical protein
MYIWDVSGSYVIPGTRTKGTLAPVRVVDHNRTAASKHIAAMLNEQHRRDLRGEHKFSDHFALYNLQWDDYQPKAAPVIEVVSV